MHRINLSLHKGIGKGPLKFIKINMTFARPETVTLTKDELYNLERSCDL